MASETYYYFDLNWKMVAGATVKDKVQTFFEVFRLDQIHETDIKTGRFELEFFIKECLDQYDQGEYKLIDGEHVVKMMAPKPKPTE